MNNSKVQRLFIILGGFFIANALIAEFIGVKIFSLEASLGISALDITFFGQTGSFDLTAGVVLWPVVFVMTDIINEYFGKRGVQFLSYLTVGLIAYAFAMVYWSINLSPSSWWIESGAENGVPDMQSAFQKIFGQGLWIIVGSLVAFLIGQIVDVTVFQRLKKITGEKRIWLRATGSTLISQFIDSFVVLFIAFYIGAGWDLFTVLAIGMRNYIYKFVIAIAMTPVIYLGHFFIDQYLGKDLSDRLKSEASSA
ncbi:queuosine precursor transporter [bacterium]|nr:queuosine precursor transporter [bacterium]